jgi:hypothetical protein
MISSELQRTLVKSPPELWAEISDPAALARHLGEFGEIRITRVEPEQRVEWEAGDTSGSVVIKPSGWGTKVKLTVTRELAEAEPEAGAESEGQPPAEAETQNPEVGEIAEPDARGAEDEAEAEAYAGEASDAGESEPEQPIESCDEPEDVAAQQADDYAERQAAPEPRRGFFARLFGRRRAAPAVEPIDEPEAPRNSARETMPPARYNALAVWASQVEADDAADGSHAPPDTSAADANGASADAAAVAEQDAAPAPTPALAPAPAPGDGQSAETPIGASPSAPASPDASADEPDAAVLGEEGTPTDISEEIGQAEEVAAEEVTAVLSGVLDRLGAAHHRPFSRA